MKFVILPDQRMVSMDRAAEYLSPEKMKGLEIVSIEKTPRGIYRSSLSLVSQEGPESLICEETPISLHSKESSASLSFGEKHESLSVEEKDKKRKHESLFVEEKCKKRKHESLSVEEKDKKRKHGSLSVEEKCKKRKVEIVEKKKREDLIVHYQSKYKHYKQLYDELWKGSHEMAGENKQLKHKNDSLRSKIREAKDQSAVIDSMTRENMSLKSEIERMKTQRDVIDLTPKKNLCPGSLNRYKLDIGPGLTGLSLNGSHFKFIGSEETMDDQWTKTFSFNDKMKKAHPFSFEDKGNTHPFSFEDKGKASPFSSDDNGKASPFEDNENTIPFDDTVTYVQAEIVPEDRDLETFNFNDLISQMTMPDETMLWAIPSASDCRVIDDNNFATLLTTGDSSFFDFND